MHEFYGDMMLRYWWRKFPLGLRPQHNFFLCSVLFFMMDGIEIVWVGEIISE